MASIEVLDYSLKGEWVDLREGNVVVRFPLSRKIREKLGAQRGNARSVRISPGAMAEAARRADAVLREKKLLWRKAWEIEPLKIRRDLRTAEFIASVTRATKPRRLAKKLVKGSFLVVFEWKLESDGRISFLEPMIRLRSSDPRNTEDLEPRDIPAILLERMKGVAEVYIWHDLGLDEQGQEE